MWGLIFICGEEREVSMKFYDEQLQKLQEQIARKRQLEAQVSEPVFGNWKPSKCRNRQT